MLAAETINSIQSAASSASSTSDETHVSASTTSSPPRRTSPRLNERKRSRPVDPRTRPASCKRLQLGSLNPVIQGQQLVAVETHLAGEAQALNRLPTAAELCQQIKGYADSALTSLKPSGGWKLASAGSKKFLNWLERISQQVRSTKANSDLLTDILVREKLFDYGRLSGPFAVGSRTVELKPGFDARYSDQNRDAWRVSQTVLQHASGALPEKSGVINKVFFNQLDLRSEKHESLAHKKNYGKPNPITGSPYSSPTRASTSRTSSISTTTYTTASPVVSPLRWS
jgi:hypothetical protein